MISSDFRDEARRKLSGKWGKAVCITLAYAVVFFILGFIEGLFPDSMEFIFSIISFIIEVPLSFGFIISFMKLYNDEEVGVFDFFTLGFSNFAKSWKISLQILLKMLVPVILIIVSYILIAFGTVGTFGAALYSSSVSATAGFGFLAIIGFILLIVSMIWAITKSYYYQLAYLVSIEDTNLTARESVEKSAELMLGKRSKLFCLELSFIGWAILAAIPFCIGYLWLTPYILFATIAFYKFVSGNNSNVEAEVVTENNDNPIQGE